MHYWEQDTYIMCQSVWCMAVRELSLVTILLLP